MRPESKKGDNLDGLLGLSKMRPAARGLILEIIPRYGTVLEIGTYDGTTIAWLAKHRKQVRFISVDAVVGKGGHHLSNWYENRGRNQCLFVGSSMAFWRILQPRARFDVIIVDGAHDEKNVRADLDMAMELLVDGGKIACHDYGFGRSMAKERGIEGVTKAIDSHIAAGHFEIYHRLGSTVFLRRPKNDGR